MVYGWSLKGRIVIQEGKKQGGWKGFGAELRHVVDPEQGKLLANGVVEQGSDKGAGGGSSQVTMARRKKQI